MSEYFSDKSAEDISAMTDADITRVIDLACANAGVPIFLEVSPPALPVAEKDIQLYKVGYYIVGKDDADKLLSVLNSCRRYAAEYNWQDSTADLTCKEVTDREEKAEPVSFYSLETYLKHKSSLETQRRQQKLFDDSKEIATKAMQDRSKLASNVWQEVENARDQIRRRSQLLERFDKYVDLADGNRSIAWKFLQAAEKLTAEDVKYFRLGDIASDIEIVPSPAVEEYQSTPVPF
jgi:hypothetical protein